VSPAALLFRNAFSLLKHAAILTLLPEREAGEIYFYGLPECIQPGPEY
jgi:hypothetical protein